MCYLVPGPLTRPEVVAVFYIRPAEVPTLSSVEGDAQVEQQNTVVGFLTREEGERRRGPESRRERRARQEERDPEGKASKAVREVCEIGRAHV